MTIIKYIKNQISNFYSMMAFWKLLFTAAVFLCTIFVWKLDSYGGGLEFHSGIKAALFALSGAAVLIIGLVPEPESEQGNKLFAVFCNLILRMVGCYAACSSAWFWIDRETNGQPDELLMFLLPLFAIPGMMIISPLIAFFLHVTDRRN